jgi:hypothetical protein
MSLLSGDSVVEEESEAEECLSSEAHPAREASAKTAKQDKIKVEGRMEILVIFINVRIRHDRIHANGVNTPVVIIINAGRKEFIGYTPHSTKILPAYSYDSKQPPSK